MNKPKSFTLIEVIVVMAVMGLILGGLLVSMRQIIEGEMLLKRMQAVEEESRFIMDSFAQDAQYSELNTIYKPSGTGEDLFLYGIQFVLTEKREELGGNGAGVENISEYTSYPESPSSEVGEYFFQRNLVEKKSNGDEVKKTAITLNNTALGLRPLFRVRKITDASGAENFLITISLTFRVERKDGYDLVPIQTSVVSRTFEI